MITPLLPDPALTLKDAVDQIRDADRCDDCGKTRAVMNIAGNTRGFHTPFRAEHVSPQTHCPCVGGPVVDIDGYQVVFRRYGAQGRITIRTAELRDEPLIVRDASQLLHAENGLNFGKRDRGSANAALVILQLLVTRERAMRLYAEFLREIIAPYGYNGGQLPFAQLRAWIAAHETPAPAEQVTAPLPGSMDEFIAGCFDGLVEGLTVSRESAGDAEHDIIEFIEKRLERTIGASDSVKLSIAIATAWSERVRSPMEVH